MHAELFVGVARCRQAEVGRCCCVDGLGRQVGEASFRWCPPALRHLLLGLREQADELVVGMELAGLGGEMIVAITSCEVPARALKTEVVDAMASTLPQRTRAAPRARAGCIARLLLLAEYPPVALDLSRLGPAPTTPPSKLPGWMQRYQQRILRASGGASGSGDGA